MCEVDRNESASRKKVFFASRQCGVAPIRIVVADDHPVVRFGVRNMLLSEPALRSSVKPRDGDDAITQTLELEPDILLLDLAMPRLPAWKPCAPSWPSRRA